MRYKVTTRRVRPSVCDFFLFALAIVSSLTKKERYLKKSKRSLSRLSLGLSLSKKKKRDPPREMKRKKVVPPPQRHQNKKVLGPHAAAAARARKFSHVRKQHFFFSTREHVYIPTSCEHFDGVSPLSRFSWCSQLYLSLCVCARDSLFCCFCRRLSSRSTTERERER